MNINEARQGTIIEACVGKMCKTAVIVEEPRLWRDGGIWIRYVDVDGIIEAPWQIKFGNLLVDCSELRHLMPAESLDRVEAVDELTEEEVDELLDAESYAEKRNRNLY